MTFSEKITGMTVRASFKPVHSTGHAREQTEKTGK
jgi:hypothetical protein